MISKVDQASLVVGGPGPNAASGSRNYYMYDGDDVAVVLTRMGTTWFVRQRILSGGLDRPLATRISPLGTATQNLAFIADRQGTTLAAVRPDGLRDETVAYFGRNVFGTLEGASGSGSSTNAETGFTGASTPNQTDGFTYLRNRWYDPQSGRFLTQDPIGLAGGVNLYAYAGNNPVTFSDPFGLWPSVASIWLPRIAQSIIAVDAFVHNFRELERGNGPDKFRHCVANCQSTRAGTIGEKVAKVLSDLKEAFDVTTGRNTPEESAEDQKANKYGREGAEENPDEPCSNVCATPYPEKRREKKGT